MPPRHNAAAAFVVPASHQADFTDRASMRAGIEQHTQAWADGMLRCYPVVVGLPVQSLHAAEQRG